MNSNGLDWCVRKSGGKILWFSADCLWRLLYRVKTTLVNLAKVKNKKVSQNFTKTVRELKILGKGPEYSEKVNR